MENVTKETRPMDGRNPAGDSLDKVKVTVTREDGSPICRHAPETTPDFLTDRDPILIITKNGDTVETISGGAFELLEFAVRQLEEVGLEERCKLYACFGLRLD